MTYLLLKKVLQVLVQQQTQYLQEVEIHLLFLTQLVLGMEQVGLKLMKLIPQEKNQKEQELTQQD